MDGQQADIDHLMQLIGAVGFVVVLILAAWQYRRRVRDIKRLTGANQALTLALAAAQARIDEMERYRAYPPGPPSTHGREFG